MASTTLKPPILTTVHGIGKRLATFQRSDIRPCFELRPAMVSYAFFQKILSRRSHKGETK